MTDLKPNFWKNQKLEDFTKDEWEALCDGCGKCCLNKLEDWDTGEIHWTNIACKLLDTKTCQCKDYTHRFSQVSDCVQLTPETVRNIEWLPQTCAYRLIKEGRDLPDWHYLKCGDHNAVHEKNASIKEKCFSEQYVSINEYKDHLIDVESL